MLESYTNEFLSATDDGSVDAVSTEAYDEKVVIDNKEIEVHVEPQGEGKPPLVYPKGEYEQWGEPVFVKKLSDQLVHNSKKAMEVLKHNNENTQAMQDLQAKNDELEKQKLRNEGIIETLQKVGTPPKVDKKPTSEPEVFNVVKRAYEIAGVSEEDWNDLTPSERFKAQSKATQEQTEHNQLQFMKQFNETSAKTNQDFMQEQKLSSMIVQAGHDTQEVKTWMKQNGVTYSEQGVSLYINFMKPNLNPKPKDDAIDELNKRTELLNRTKTPQMAGAQAGFRIMTPKDKELKEFCSAVKTSEVDKNQKANEILGI